MKMKIKYRMKSPLSHIGETASTGSYFQTVLTSSGRLPVVTGNSIRGQIRDACALHMLRILSESDMRGVELEKDAFNVLFSGGNLNGTMRDDVAKARAIRQHFPMVSLLGGGLGDMIMAGKLLCGFAYLVCSEAQEITGIPSETSWHSLIDEIEFTRTDDGKNDKLSGWLADAGQEKTAKASTQMRYSVQYIAAGAELVQELSLLPGTEDLERGALYAGLREWFKVPRLGGMAAKGFGFFEPQFDAVDGFDALINRYEAFLRAEGTEYLKLLSSTKEGAKKRGKAADKTA